MAALWDVHDAMPQSNLTSSVTEGKHGNGVKHDAIQRELPYCLLQ
jgi:hypothetical protein